MTTKYITLPPMDPTYLNKVYSIKINDKQIKKVIGVKKAIGTWKYFKYSNFNSVVSFTNVATNTLVKSL